MVLDTLEQIKEDLVNETKEKVVEEGEEFKTKDLNRSVVVYPNINSTTAKVNYAAEVKKENTIIDKEYIENVFKNINKKFNKIN